MYRSQEYSRPDGSPASVKNCLTKKWRNPTYSAGENPGTEIDAETSPVKELVDKDNKNRDGNGIIFVRK